MGVGIGEDANLDTIFSEVGEFNVFQVVNYILIALPNMLAAAYVMNYAFTATTLDYRCKVPECDLDLNNRQIEYNQPWLSYAIPSDNNTFSDCFRYAPINSSNTPGECSAQMFNTTKRIACTEFVYKGDEKNVQTEFNIHCSDSYKLALIGTMNNIGRFVFFPLTGILSDKFGRLTVVIFGMICASICGIIKSFSFSYGMILLMEFLEASAGTCTFAAIYVLSIEGVSTKYRVISSSLISSTFPVGEILLGLLAMYIHDFRYMLRALYTPGLLVITYFWLAPESVRWLLVTGRVDRAIKVLKRTAFMNRKHLSEKSIELLKLKYEPNVARETTVENAETAAEKHSLVQSLCSIFTSKELIVRFFSGCFCWVTCCFVYFGLSLNSTQISGEDRYLSYINVAAVEIPGILLGIPLLSRFPRRRLLLCTLFISGFTIMVTPWVPQEKSTIILMLFMIGKSSITCAFTVLYIFTAEVWPTSLRTTMMNLSSMIGRIGGMVAPMTPILAQHFAMLPFLLFGGTAIIAGLLMQLLPETLNKKLPDTIEEARDL